MNTFDVFNSKEFVGEEYHTYESMKTDLETFETDYSEIVKLYDIGDSNEGRNIYAMKITDCVLFYFFALFIPI